MYALVQGLWQEQLLFSLIHVYDKMKIFRSGINNVEDTYNKNNTQQIKYREGNSVNEKWTTQKYVTEKYERLYSYVKIRVGIVGWVIGW